MKQALMTVANWIWNKITNIDYAMIAAAFVEVPRWAVAFAAIREPMWAAVPMGLLLAWAASAGWKAYFEDKSRVLLLIINSASLVGALIVIAPVLYAMTYMPLDSIDLSQVLPPEYLWVWAIVLSITTFVPLVQVAAVKAYHAAPQHTTSTTSSTTPATSAGNAAVHDTTGGATEPQRTTVRDVPELHTIVSMSNGDIGKLLDIDYRNVQGWRKRGTLERNIVQRLPALATPHVNGHNGSNGHG
jgi:hypothetical protein